MDPKHPTALIRPRLTLARMAFMVIATAVCALCIEHSVAHAQNSSESNSAAPKARPGVSAKSAPAGGSVKSNDPLSQIRGIVRAIADQRQVSVAFLESLFGARLTQRTDVPGQLWYEAELPKGPFDKLSFRVPSTPEQKLHMVGLRVRPTVNLTTACGITHDGDGKKLQMDFSSPHDPNKTMTFIVADPSGRNVKYVFEREPERLRTVAVDL